jgi:hypothetical protein
MELSRQTKACWACRSKYYDLLLRRFRFLILLKAVRSAATEEVQYACIALELVKNASMGCGYLGHEKVMHEEASSLVLAIEHRLFRELVILILTLSMFNLPTLNSTTTLGSAFETRKQESWPCYEPVNAMNRSQRAFLNPYLGWYLETGISKEIYYHTVRLTL